MFIRWTRKHYNRCFVAVYVCAYFRIVLLVSVCVCVLLLKTHMCTQTAKCVILYVYFPFSIIQFLFFLFVLVLYFSSFFLFSSFLFFSFSFYFIEFQFEKLVVAISTTYPLRDLSCFLVCYHQRCRRFRYRCLTYWLYLHRLRWKWKVSMRVYGLAQHISRAPLVFI